MKEITHIHIEERDTCILHFPKGYVSSSSFCHYDVMYFVNSTSISKYFYPLNHAYGGNMLNMVFG